MPAAPRSMRVSCYRATSAPGYDHFMIKRLGVSLVAMSLVLATAGGAMAAQLNVNDAANDNARKGLDIVEASIGNRDRAVVATVSFRKERLGSVIVAVKSRNHGAVVLVVKHQANQDRVFFFTRNDEGKCPRLRVDWMAKQAAVQFRMPARCLNGGNYGAIKTWVLTEGAGGGSDVDYAPVNGKGRLTYTPWISRG